MVIDSDRESRDVGYSMAGRRARADGEDLKVMRIINTMEIGHFWASEALAQEIQASGKAELVGPAAGFAFGDAGEMLGLRNL